MANEETAFLEAIAAKPEDDGRRLAFADWLAEHGQPERGEFIRLQCDLARWPADDPRRAAPEVRQDQLLTAHHHQWWGQHVQEVTVTYRRGLPEHISCQLPAFLSQADTIFRLAPVVSLKLEPTVRRAAYPDGFGTEGTHALLATPHLHRLRSLDLGGQWIGDEGMNALVASPQLQQLTTLSLADCRIGPAGAHSLADAPLLGGLTTLHLGGGTSWYYTGNRLAADGVLALMTSPHFRQVENLNLDGLSYYEFYGGDYSPCQNIGDEGVVVVANAPAAARLRVLSLYENALTDCGYAALTASPHLSQLEQLFLGDNWGYGGNPHPMSTAVQQALGARFGSRLIFRGSDSTRGPTIITGCQLT